MKHLRHYHKSVTNLDEVMNDVKDICLELSDNGFKYTLWCKKDIYLDLWKRDLSVFKIGQIKDVIERLIEYLTPLGFTYENSLIIGRGDGEDDTRVTKNINDDINEYIIIFKRKHLKYNENIFNRLIGKKPFLSKKVIQDIRDICIELQDDGFKVFTNQLDFNKLGKREGFYPNIEIFKPNGKYFDFDEVKEVVERLKDYVSEFGYKINIEKDYYQGSELLGLSNPLENVKLIFTK